jgi:hypothetical protein
MGFSNFDKLSIALIVLTIILGLSSSAYAITFADSNDQQAWIQSNSSTLQFTYLEANIHLKIHNNNDHAEFFKISQQYTGDGTVTVTGTNSSAIEWKIMSTTPPAVRMINSINPAGDLGWEVGAGQTKEVWFKLVESSPPTPFFIQTGSGNNTFWPTINDPGLTATWFLPNEIEYLNPNLKLELWQGRFCFILKNLVSSGPRVEGTVRAPIVPIDSVLTASNPTVDFISTENPSAQTAAWTVSLNPLESKHYSYTYQWPNGTSVTPVHQQSTANINVPSTAKNSTTVPTKNTGVPWGLFLIGGIVIAAGIIYAKVIR